MHSWCYWEWPPGCQDGDWPSQEPNSCGTKAQSFQVQSLQIEEQGLSRSRSRWCLVHLDWCGGWYFSANQKIHASVQEGKYLTFIILEMNASLVAHPLRCISGISFKKQIINVSFWGKFWPVISFCKKPLSPAQVSHGLIVYPTLLGKVTTFKLSIHLINDVYKILEKLIELVIIVGLCQIL